MAKRKRKRRSLGQTGCETNIPSRVRELWDGIDGARKAFEQRNDCRDAMALLKLTEKAYRRLDKDTANTGPYARQDPTSKYWKRCRWRFEMVYADWDRRLNAYCRR